MVECGNRGGGIWRHLVRISARGRRRCLGESAGWMGRRRMGQWPGWMGRRWRLGESRRRRRRCLGQPPVLRRRRCMGESLVSDASSREECQRGLIKDGSARERTRKKKGSFELGNPPLNLLSDFWRLLAYLAGLN